MVDSICDRLGVALMLTLLASCAFAQNAPAAAGKSIAPDEWLLFSAGRPWWYQSRPAASVSPVIARKGTAEEQPVINRARELMAQYPVRALALLDGDSVIYSAYGAPATVDSLFFGFSMGKTVTSMAVGQAICSGKLRFETSAEEVVPELQDTALGHATVRDLWRMASGAGEPLSDSTIWTPEQFTRWNQGTLTILESVTERRVTKAARGLFSDYEPGEYFYYKSTDPMVLGLMVRRATGMSFGEWVQEAILDPMGAAKVGFIVQDREGDGAADAGVRLRFEDWIRFAQWVKRSSKASGCLGDYVRAAMSSQIPNRPPSNRKAEEAAWDGYGYLVWTGNRDVPHTSWALGHAGESISWDANSDRIVVVFANAYPQTRSLERDWNRLDR